MPERTLITPLDTISADELRASGSTLDALPENIREVLAGLATGEFIVGLGTKYSLAESHCRGVARFLLELILTGNVPTSRTADTLARTSGLDMKTSLQVIKELDSELLAPLGLTLAGFAAPAGGPDPVIGPAGEVTGLRYATVDDLLADVAELPPDDRGRFLSDAKRDNRMIVLQALSQLKMGTDSRGRPLSFRQLVAQEGSSFSPEEWVALAGVDPDALADPAILVHIASTPLGAMLQGRDAAVARDVVRQFLALPANTRRTLADRVVGAAIARLVGSGILPETHIAAAGRILFFVATGQAHTGDIAELLGKIGVRTESAAAAARELASLIPVSREPEPPQEPAPTRPAPGLNVPKNGSRTILDLRKPRP